MQNVEYRICYLLSFPHVLPDRPNTIQCDPITTIIITTAAAAGPIDCHLLLGDRRVCLLPCYIHRSGQRYICTRAAVDYRLSLIGGD